MRDRQLDRLFDRFRRKGDAAALGKVFDNTAPELVEVAVHLTREAGEAEDLVQATFLTAIEKADDYDADRRLMPWLVGILVRHAHALRRKRAREIDEERLPPGGTADPSDEAQAAELRDSIEEALAGLPENYRSVLEPYLLRGERAVDIARASGRSPGTVRVQIRRGLDEFRRALPAGLALGAGVLVGGRSMAEVRATVLDRAARTLGPAKVSLSSTTILGGLAMSQKLLFGALGAALLVLLGWVATIGGDEPPVELAAGPPPVGSIEFGPTPEAGPSIEAKVEPARVEVAAERPEIDEAAVASYEAALAGITGRVVEWNGRAVAGLSVTLLELRPAMVGASLDAPFQSTIERGLRSLDALPWVAEQETDAEGRFRLGGAHPGGVHAIGIDLDGERPTWRLVDQALRSGEQIDIGTIERAEVRAIRGRVLDAEGKGLAGVRVRAALLPEWALPLAGLRAGATLILRDRTDGTVVDLPARFGALLEKLPIPRTVTDPEGRFELRGVVGGANWLIADAAGFRPVSQALNGEEREVGELRLEPLGLVRGRLVDSEGAAVVGAEVCGGSYLRFDASQDGLAICTGRDTTDDEGHFEFAGAPADEKHELAVRRSPRSPWKVEGGFGDGDTVVVPAALGLSCTLRDLDGGIVPDATFHLIRGEVARILESLGVPSLPIGEPERLAPGRYALHGLIEGRYRLTVRAGGFATADRWVEVAEDGQELELALSRCGPRAIEVIDRRTGRPLAGARVSLGDADREAATRARGVSDTNGHVLLQRVPVEGEAELVLRVAHPGYATLTQTVQLGDQQVTVELDAAGGARFRMRAGGGPPSESLMVMAEPALGGSFADSLCPHLALSAVDGVATLERLSAGECRYYVYRRFPERDPLALLANDALKGPLVTGRFEVLPGEMTEIEVELDPRLFAKKPPGEGCLVEGTVRIAGESCTGVSVVVHGISSMARLAEQDLRADGDFRFDDLPAGRHLLVVRKKEDVPLAVRGFTIESGERVHLEVVIDPIEFEVRLVDAAGDAVTDGWLGARPLDEASRQGGPPRSAPAGEGRRRLTVWAGGRYRLEGSSPTAGSGSLEIEVATSAPGPFEVRFSPGVPCAGEVYLPAGTTLKEPRAIGSIRRVDGTGLEHHLGMQFDQGQGSFAVYGLEPGEYLLTLVLDPRGEHSCRARFELPATGDGNLSLQLETYTPATPPGATIILDED